MLKKETAMPDEYKPQLSDNALDLRYFSSEFTDLPKRESIIGDQAKQYVKRNAHLFKEFDNWSNANLIILKFFH